MSPSPLKPTPPDTTLPAVLPPTIQIHVSPGEQAALDEGTGLTAIDPATVVPNEISTTFAAYTTALGKTLPFHINRARGFINRLPQAVR